MKLVLVHPVSLILACLCIQWLDLGTLGAFSIKLPYVVLALGILYAASSGRRVAACLQFIRQNQLWIAPLAVYLVLLAATLYGSPAQNMPLRQMFYLLCAIAFAGSLAMARNIGMVVRVGAALALGLFVITVEVLARRIGLSWIDAVVQFIGHGDRQFVAHQFLRGVFNAVDPNSDTMISASRKNGIAVGVLTAALLFRAASVRASRDWLGTAVFGFALVLLFLLNTRSVMIVAGASILLATAISTVVRPAQRSTLMLKLLVAVGVIGLAFAYTGVESPAAGTMSDRFAFDDQSTSERLNQYSAAFEQIERHPLTGNGYFEVGGQPIHNLFLSAWVHAGLAAFILVVVFYGALLSRWLFVLRNFINRPDRWVIPIAFEWVAPLPILPLFRVWLAGDGGHLFLGEWIAIAAFLGFVLANDLGRRTVARRFARRSAQSAGVGAVGSLA